MTRPIKFRAWYPILGVMKSKVPIEVEGSDLNEVFSYISQFPQQIVLMQFTGLLDKNGVEIYEGDILASVTSKTTDWEVKWHEQWARWIGTGYNHASRRHFVVGAEKMRKSEVIGNVFMNPELLTPQSNG